MAIPRTIMMTPDGELDLTKGFRLTSTLVEFVVQALRQNIRFFLGEWFLDTRKGVPYFEQVFVNNPDLPLLTSLYRRVILATTGVGSVESLALNFDRKTRTLAVEFVAVLVDGTSVPFKEDFVLG